MRIQTRVSRTLAVVLMASVTGLGVSSLAAQAIPKPDYFTYMPPGSGISLPIRQTRASAALHLFGDETSPGYRDVNPRDGIDDERNVWFLKLSERFAPWIVRHSVGFPMDLRRWLEGGQPFPMFMDVFDVSRHEPRLVRTDAIDWNDLRDRPCPAGGEASNPQVADCQLLRLLRRFAPGERPPPSPPAAEEHLSYSMYFDFPGEDPASWAREYEGTTQGAPSRKLIGYAKSFVKPFIVSLPKGPDGIERFEFVLQYWFFYPYNDAGNVHEGDMEHLNVVVTTKELWDRKPTADQIRPLIDGTVPLDQVIISRTEHYFHHWAFVTDYLKPNLYAPRADWEREAKSIKQERYGEQYRWLAARSLAYLDDKETELTLHPKVFVGGDGKGLNAILAPPSRLGRSSHGSFPFPALYKDIGPQGTGEVINTPWDIFRQPPAADAPETEKVIRYDNPARLEILPDWERVLPLMWTDPEVRRRYAWMVLPIRFGYPATKSPFAGIVKYAETGNLSIQAPSFSGGWNRVGDGEGYEYYEPHRLSATYPGSIQDNFIQSWGFLNLTLPTLVSLPPFDVAWRLIRAPFNSSNPIGSSAFYNSETVPYRFIGATIGLSRFTPPTAFMGLFGFPELYEPLLQALSGLGVGNIQSVPPTSESSTDPVYGVSLFLGRKFVSENTLRHSRNLLSQDFVLEGIPGSHQLSGELNMWEYAGSLRYNLATGGFQPFIKGGYGLSWYRIEKAKLDTTILGDGNSRWVRKPGFIENLFPNTLHLGAGFEFLPISGVGTFDWGLRLEGMLFSHNLGTKGSDNELVLTSDRRVTRWHVNVGTTISF